MRQNYYGSDSEGCIPLGPPSDQQDMRAIRHRNEFDQASDVRELIIKPVSYLDAIDNIPSIDAERWVDRRCLIESWLRRSRDSAMGMSTTTVIPILEDRIGFIERVGFLVHPEARKLLDEDLQMAISAKDVVNSILKEVQSAHVSRPSELDAFLDPETKGPEMLRIVVHPPGEMDWEQQMSWWDTLSNIARRALPTESLKYRVVISVEPATGGDVPASTGIH